MNPIILAVMLAVAPSAHESHPGETMDQFVVRISRTVELEGIRRNAEVCGAIQNRGGVFTLTVNHKQDNIQCTVSHGPDDVLLHTHLPYMGQRFSPADYAHRGYMIRKGVVCFNDGARGTEALVTKSGRRAGSVCAAQ